MVWYFVLLWHDMIRFLFSFSFFFSFFVVVVGLRRTPGALSPAPNIIDIYFEREHEEERERDAERKEIIHICVYVLLINFILGYLFPPSFGTCSQAVFELIQAPGGALVTIFNALFSGIIGYILAAIIGAFATNNTDKDKNTPYKRLQG